MSDFMDGDKFPNRPDVPEFWHLSEIVLGNDAEASEKGSAGLLGVIEKIIPIEVLQYMATQRALIQMHRVFHSKYDELNVPMMMSAAWIDGFAAGAKYGQKYPKDSDNDIAIWKTVAAKLAYLVVDKSEPSWSQEDKVRGAAELLGKALAKEKKQ